MRPSSEMGHLDSWLFFSPTIYIFFLKLTNKGIVPLFYFILFLFYSSSWKSKLLPSLRGQFQLLPPFLGLILAPIFFQKWKVLPLKQESTLCESILFDFPPPSPFFFFLILGETDKRTLSLTFLFSFKAQMKKI